MSYLNFRKIQPRKNQGRKIRRRNHGRKKTHQEIYNLDEE